MKAVLIIIICFAFLNNMNIEQAKNIKKVYLAFSNHLDVGILFKLNQDLQIYHIKVI
jgi:hypothetical protein